LFIFTANAQAQRLEPTPQAAVPVRCSTKLGVFFVKNKDLTPFFFAFFAKGATLLAVSWISLLGN